LKGEIFQDSIQNWQILVNLSKDENRISLGVTNGILNYLGGTQIDFFFEQLRKNITAFLKQKYTKEEELTFKVLPKRVIQSLQANVSVIISGCVKNPDFHNQIKLKLKTPHSKFCPPMAFS
jgi:DNA gyrase/topoisomerase IV subunit B